jgi:hypothetical protein
MRLDATQEDFRHCGTCQSALRLRPGRAYPQVMWKALTTVAVLVAACGGASIGQRR